MIKRSSFNLFMFPDSVGLLSGKNAPILFFGVYLTVVINLIRKYRTFDICSI